MHILKYLTKSTKDPDLSIDVHPMRMAIRAYNHNVRKQLLKLLKEQGELTVTDIYIQLRLEQSVASQHLKILRKAGFVKGNRQGKNVYYSICPERIEQLKQAAACL